VRARSVVVVGLRALGRAADRALEERGAVDEHLADLEAVGGQVDRPLGQPREGHLAAVLLERHPQHPAQPRHGRRHGTDLGHPGEHDLLRVDVVLGEERGDLPSGVEHFGAADRAAGGNHHEAAAAQAGGHRFDDAEGQRDRDGRLDGVAAFGEDFTARVGRQRVGGHHHPFVGSGDLHVVGQHSIAPTAEKSISGLAFGPFGARIPVGSSRVVKEREGLWKARFAASHFITSPKNS
jgi:hypothetical protein